MRKEFKKPPHHTMISDAQLDQPYQPSVGNFAPFGAPRGRSKIPHSMLGLLYWSTSSTDPDALRDAKSEEGNTLRQRGRDTGIINSEKVLSRRTLFSMHTRALTLENIWETDLPLLSPDSSVTCGYLSPVPTAVSPVHTASNVLSIVASYSKYTKRH